MCALFPLRVLGVAVLLVGACALGLLRFRVETAPERLWVGPQSQAAREAARFEGSFGPFYRVAQASHPPRELASFSTGLSVTAAREWLLQCLELLLGSSVCESRRKER